MSKHLKILFIRSLGVFWHAPLALCVKCYGEQNKGKSEQESSLQKELQSAWGRIMPMAITDHEYPEQCCLIEIVYKLHT